MTSTWNCAASRIRTPSSSAFASFEPAPGPGGDEVGLLRHARRGLAARLDDRLLRALARVPLERSGGDDGESLEHAARRPTAAPGPGCPGVASCAPAAVQRSTISRCQSTSNQSISESAMIPPTPSTAGELVARCRADRVDRPEPLRERARGDGPDVADVQRDEEPPQILGLRGLEVREQLRRGGGEDEAGVAVEGAVGVERADRSSCAAGGTATGCRAAVLEQPRQAGLGIAHDDVDRRRGPRARGRTARPRWRAAGPRAARAGSAPPPTPRRAPRCRAPPREPTCSTRPRTCAGQERAFGQRRSMSPAFAGASGEPHSGHVRRASRTRARCRRAARRRGRAPRGSRRRPCAARRCRRSARPWP